MSLLSSIPPPLRPLTALEVRRIARDVDEELRFHIESCVEACLERGMTPEEAREEARRRFGDPSSIASQCVRAQMAHPWRALVRATETVLTLVVACGLGVGVALLMQGALFRSPVPFHDEARRVAVWWHDAASGQMYSGSTYEEFRALDAMDDVFEHVTLARYQKVNVVGAAGPERVRSKYVSANYFDFFGARPILGGSFTEGPGESADRPEVVLSHALWKRQYAEDHAVLGTPMSIDGQEHTIVGVMPATVPMYLKTDLFLSMAMPAVDPHFRTLLAGGRLRPGVSLASARQRVAETLGDAGTLSPRVRTLEDVYTANVRPRMSSEMALVGLLLVGLFLHAVQRRIAAPLPPPTSRSGADPEAAMRGWSRAGIVVLIAVAGSCIGLLLAGQIATVLAPSVFGELRPLFDVRSDLGIVLATLGMAALAGLVLQWLGNRAQNPSTPRITLARRLTRGALTAGEVAVALVLLLGLLEPARGLMRSTLEGPGFDEQRLFVVEAAAIVQAPGPRLAPYERMVEALRHHDAIEAAGATVAFPMRRDPWRLRFHDPLRPGPRHLAHVTAVLPGFFDALAVPVLRGRDFSEGSVSDRRNVAVINQAFAERLGGDPVGRTLALELVAYEVEIVGVVDNVRHGKPGTAPEPTLYRPLAQTGDAGAVDLFFRLREDDEALAEAVTGSLGQLEPTIAVGKPVEGGRILRDSRSDLRLRVGWLGALVLIAWGIAVFDLAGLVLDGIAAVSASSRGTLATRARRVVPELVTVSLSGGVVAVLAIGWIEHGLSPIRQVLDGGDPVPALTLAAGLAFAAGLALAMSGWYARSLDPHLRT